MTGRLTAIAVKPRKRAPMDLLEQVSVSTETGLAGDSRGKPGRRQVTILFADDWRAALAGLKPSAPWTIRRANLLLDGVANPKTPGGVLAIGAVRLLITGETTPCFRMDEQLPGLQAAMTPHWFGGLTARVIAGGEIAVGAAAEWLASERAAS